MYLQVCSLGMYMNMWLDMCMDMFTMMKRVQYATRSLWRFRVTVCEHAHEVRAHACQPFSYSPAAFFFPAAFFLALAARSLCARAVFTHESQPATWAVVLMPAVEAASM